MVNSHQVQINTAQSHKFSIYHNKFFEHQTVKNLGGKESLLPYFELAKKMLGAVENPYTGESDHLMRETAAEIGREDTFHKTQVGVYFGDHVDKQDLFVRQVRRLIEERKGPTLFNRERIIHGKGMELKQKSVEQMAQQLLSGIKEQASV